MKAILKLSIFLLAFAALSASAQQTTPVHAQVRAIRTGKLGASPTLYVQFTWGNPIQTTCPGTNPSSCATNYTLMDTTGLAVGTLPTAACSTAVQTGCIAATGIALTATSYQYTPLVAISPTTAYSHTFVLQTNGYDALGQAATAPSNTASVTYTPYTLPTVGNFAGSVQ